VTDQNPPDPGHQQMAPGWYPDPTQAGHQREWDGQQWVGPSVPIGGQKKGGFPKWLIPVIACLVLGVVAVIGGALAGSGDDEDAPEDVSAEETTTEAAEETTTTEAEEEPAEETTTEAPTTTEAETTTTEAPTTTEAAAAPIVQSGQGDGQTAPLEVPAGTYAVHYNFGADCFYGGTLERTDGGFELIDLGSGQGPLEGDTFVYNVEGGEYYVAMITGPAPGCPWEITLTPQD
jgi:hypothetical protein